MENGALLQVENLKTYFFTRRGALKAVDGVSFSLREGEALGLVGESGSGKTMTCLSILRLVPQPAARIVGGSIFFAGQDILRMPERELRKLRGSQIAMILQDPMASLNPVFTIGTQVGEVVEIHQGTRGDSVKDKVKEILHLVGIPSPEVRITHYPHQMSGGMRQRVAGAIAISCRPRLLIADEPTTSLDVTVQAQYLRLLKDLQRRLNLALIFITHDLGIVAKMCDQVAVMYAGRVVEFAAMRTIFNDPVHPYTLGLMRCLPRLEEELSRLETIDGQPPALDTLPPGCAFAPRCDLAQERCREEYPPLVPVAPGHTVHCWRAE